MGRVRTWLGLELIAVHAELVARLEKVDRVGFDLALGLDPDNAHLRMPGQDLVHQALEVRRQMLDDDERRTGVLGEVIEELLNRRKPPGGGTNADEWRAQDSGVRHLTGHVQLLLN